jgi:hypothetical protein
MTLIKKEYLLVFHDLQRVLSELREEFGIRNNTFRELAATPGNLQIRLFLIQIESMCTMPVSELEGVHHSRIQLNFLADCRFAPFGIPLSLGDVFGVVVDYYGVIYEELGSLVHFQVESILFSNRHHEEPFEKN